MCCNAMLFPGNPHPLSSMLGGPVVPLVCGFTRRDNLLAGRELFTNLFIIRTKISHLILEGRHPL